MNPFSKINQQHTPGAASGGALRAPPRPEKGVFCSNYFEIRSFAFQNALTKGSTFHNKYPPGGDPRGKQNPPPGVRGGYCPKNCTPWDGPRDKPSPPPGATGYSYTFSSPGPAQIHFQRQIHPPGVPVDPTWGQPPGVQSTPLGCAVQLIRGTPPGQQQEMASKNKKMPPG